MNTPKLFPVALLLLLISCGQSQNLEKIKEKYTFDDMNIYLEKVNATDTNPDRYTIDNKAYTINKKYTYAYTILRGNDTLKIKAPKFTAPDEDYQRAWDFIPKRKQDENAIETISITVLPGLTNTNQTMLKYEYQYPVAGGNHFYSTSGVIENEMNTWMHPHRDKYFMILELNPFPYIQQPFKTGHTWTWNLTIGDPWGDSRWKTWTGSIENRTTYEITGKEKINTKIGTMECWVVEAVATSRIGSTGLIAYYHETNGFVRLDYINIDKSKVSLELIRVDP